MTNSQASITSALVGLFALLASGVAAYSDINSDIKTLKDDMAEADEDRLSKTVVIEMLKNKDIQIQAVKENVIKVQQQGDKIENKIDKQNELLLEIIKNMPPKPS